MAKEKKRVTLDEAIEILNKHFGMPEGKNALAKGTLYNYISKKKLHRYGPHRVVLLDPDEVIAVCGERSA